MCPQRLISSSTSATAGIIPSGGARRALPWLIVLALVTGGTAVASAESLHQQPALLTAETAHFRLHAPPELASALETAATRVEPIYQALSSALDASLPEGTVIRLWSMDEQRAGIDPSSRRVDGVVVPRLQLRRVLDIRLPTEASADASAAKVDEALGLILATQLLAVASDGRIPPGLQVGAARYLQAPGETTASLVARLREALSAPAPTWSAINRAGAEYEDPPLHQAWSLSVAHFLLQRRGFATFNRFVAGLKRADGWRSALAEAYGEDGGQLEAAWRAGLAAYTNGGWQEHLLYGIDLGRAADHLAAGDFRGAAAQMRAALGGLEPRSAQETTAARDLLQRAESATRARGDLELGLSFLNSGAYRPALAAAEAALPPLAAVGDQAGSEQARVMAERARIGLAAEGALQRAHGLPPWRRIEAVILARRAAGLLAGLGDEVGALAAARWAHERSLPAGALGALLAMGAVALLGRNLVARRRSPERPA